MKLIYLKSALKCDSFDVAIGIKIPFFRVLVTIEPDRSLLQFVTANCLIYWSICLKKKDTVIYITSEGKSCSQTYIQTFFCRQGQQIQKCNIYSTCKAHYRIVNILDYMGIRTPNAPLFASC